MSSILLWNILYSLIGTSSHQSTPLCAAIKGIDMYLADDVLPIRPASGTFNCPMKWWNEHQHMYPNLAKVFKRFAILWPPLLHVNKCFLRQASY